MSLLLESSRDPRAVVDVKNLHQRLDDIKIHSTNLQTMTATSMQHKAQCSLWNIGVFEVLFQRA